MKALLTLFATATFIFAEPTVTRIGEGPVDNRIQIVIIGDGYTAQDIQDLYIPTVESTLEYMLEHPIKNRPYPRYKKFLNFYRIDIESEDSGVDLIHGKQDHEKVYRNTALGGEDGCTDYAIAKVCGADWDLVHETIDALAAKENFLPNWYLVMLNDTRYNAAAHHAGGRKLPIYSAHYEGNWDMRDVALHEAAHAWHNLADEYGGSGNYTGGEPSEVNVTIDPNAPKWSNWLGYIMPEGDTMGIFEGGKYKNSGIYRPSNGSKMNGGPDDCHALNNDCGHNMVGIEKIIHDIYELVDPVDFHTDTSKTLINPETLTLSLIDSTVSMVDWIIDGDTILPYGPTQLSLKEYLTTPGTYTVTARIWDEVIAHAFSDNVNPNPLDLVRSDLDKLEKSVTWTVQITDAYGMSSSSEVLSSATPLSSSSEFVYSEDIENPPILLESSAEDIESSIDALDESSEAKTALGTPVTPFSISLSSQGLSIRSELNGVAHIKVWDVMGHLLLSKAVHTGNNSLPTHLPTQLPTGLLIYGIEHNGVSASGVQYWVR